MNDSMSLFEAIDASCHQGVFFLAFNESIYPTLPEADEQAMDE
jgi:hypothetical protein